MVRGLTVTFAVFCLVAGIIVGAAIWIFYTTAGADFTLRHLSQKLDFQFQVGQLEGSLARGVTVNVLALEQADINLQARQIHLEMLVSSLYPFHITFSTIAIEDAVLTLPSAEPTRQQPVLHLQIPQLPKMLDLLRVDIAHLDIVNFVLVQGDEITAIKELSATSGFHQRSLSIADFNLVVDEMSVNAAATLDMADSALDLTATVKNYGIDQLWKTIVVESSLAGVDPDIVRGTIKLKLQLDNMEPFYLQTDVTIGENSFAYDELFLQQSQRLGAVLSTGQLHYGEDGPTLMANFVLQGLDLSQDTGIPLEVSGEIALSYARMQYQGHFDLVTRGDDLVSAELGASFSGDHQQLRLGQIEASWLDARINGSLDFGWSQALDLVAQLQIEQLSLDPFVPDSKSLLNGNLSARYRHDEQSPQASINLELYDSSFYEYPLSGIIAADYENNNLILHQLDLLSNSAQLQAQGDLQNNINFTLTLQQLADFYPPVDGILTAQGWFHYGKDGSAADVQLAGTDLSYDQWQLATLQSRLLLDVDHTLSAAVQLRRLGSTTHSLLVDEFDLEVAGSLLNHRVNFSARTQEADITATLQASWSESLWAALLQQLEVDSSASQWRLNRPASITVGPQIMRISEVLLDSGSQQSVRFRGEFLPAEESLEVDLEWSELSLNLFRHWLDPSLLRGNSDGTLSLLHQPENTQIHLSALLNADLRYQQLHLQGTNSRLTLDWGKDGLTGNILVDLGSQAQLLLDFHSPDSPGVGLPDRTNIVLACRQVPLQLIQPWLPSEIVAQGIISGDLDGWWSADNTFALYGKADISAGSMYWYDDEQEIKVDVEKATIELTWQEQALRAQTALIHSFGHINSRFEVEVPAHVPITFPESAPITADISLFLQESGFLSVFFPQYIYDSKGEIDLTAAISGTVSDPLFSGTFDLQGAEFYVPAAGIRVFDIQAAAQLGGQQLNISNLRMTSSKGTISGQGRVDLLGWSPDNYHFSVVGEGFQLVNLSEVAIQVSPDLVIDGNLDTVRVRGRVNFPQVMIKDQTSSQAVQNSPDLVIVDRQTSIQSTSSIRHDIDVNLILGDQVLLDIAGLQARVAGSLRLYSDAQQDVAAQGRLFVERGRFSSYGVSLDIERGDLYFAGVPLRYPTLDILAIRRAGQVRAGVRVTGTPQEPVVSLYSEPTMPDADILSYVVLGRPLDSSGGDTDLLMLATGALLSQGESIILQERLKGRLGLDVLEFSAGDGDSSDAVITTGKYITPDLYVILGYSLFNNSNEIRIRYRLSSRLELESSLGQESGVDLFYRLERDNLFKN